MTDNNQIGLKNKRNTIMKAAKILRSKQKPVYVNDHLTRTNAEVFACVRKKQSDIVKSSCTREGTIFYRDINDQTHIGTISLMA